jgi:DNA-binding response OmpR family regulator
VLVVADEAVSGRFIAHVLATAGLVAKVVEDVAAAAAAIDRGASTWS